MERAEEYEARGQREREEAASRLALRYHSGDRAALGELYAALEPLIRHFLRAHLSVPRSLSCGVEAADLHQQSYVALADTALEWDPERRDNFMPYFYHSFPWRMERYVRTQSPTRRTSRIQLFSLPHDLLVERMDGMAGPDGRDWDGALACAELMGELPGPYARVVRLHLFHGLSFAEVGAALGIGRSAAHESFGRAMALLRSRVEEEWGQNGKVGHEPTISPKGGGVGALRRCVEVMHRLAPGNSLLPGRATVCDAAGLTGREYRGIMERLCARGCVVGRRPGSPGSLACARPEETLRRLRSDG
jgi:RNA polymerase sigma factor (sigma-70 family)